MKKFVYFVTFSLLGCSTQQRYEDNSVVLKVYNLCGQDTSYVIPQGVTKMKICDRNITVDRMGSSILVQIPEVQVHLTYHDLLIDDKPWDLKTP